MDPAAAMDVERRADAVASSGKPVLKRILVVDDARAQANSLAMLLRLIGFDVRTANHGAGAIAVAREFCPEVGLIDIGLPDMSGYEVALRLRELPELKNIVLIAQTGWGRDEDRAQSRQAGFDYHLTKPIDHRLLEEILTSTPKITDDQM
jgi:CheY-like chemotaxis protein